MSCRNLETAFLKGTWRRKKTNKKNKIHEKVLEYKPNYFGEDGEYIRLYGNCLYKLLFLLLRLPQNFYHVPTLDDHLQIIVRSLWYFFPIHLISIWLTGKLRQHDLNLHKAVLQTTKRTKHFSPSSVLCCVTGYLVQKTYPICTKAFLKIILKNLVVQQDILHQDNS